MFNAVVTTLSNLGGFAGIAALLGVVLPRLKQIEKDSEIVRIQLTPNHGSSMKDQIRRIEKSIDQIQETSADWHGSLGHQIGEIRRDFRSEIDSLRADMRSMNDKLSKD
ncbi:hypothetical protein [Arcanobacterium canis]